MTFPEGASQPGGRLVVMGTPIGNLEDMSPRARRVLGDADVIYCEDTRRTRKLLSAFGIPAPKLVRMDGHAEQATSAEAVAAVAGGRTAVLVSDAGMPAISDPGSLAVAAVAAAGLAVEVIPGPTAVSAALAVSGLPASQYRFAGFLPRRGGDRTRILDNIAKEEVTTVVYESPSRVVATVADLTTACGADRAFVAARELTKVHEEVWRGTLGGAAPWLASREPPRGEWVLLIGGLPATRRTEISIPEVEAALAERLAAGADRREAVSDLSAELGVPKRVVYEAALALKRAGGQGAPNPDR